MGENRDVFRVLVGKTEGKRLLGRPRRRWDGNIRWLLRKWDGTRTGLIWCKIGTDGVLL